MQTWNVYSRNKKIDTVFYSGDCEADYVRRSLVHHDGYPSDIVVKKA